MVLMLEMLLFDDVKRFYRLLIIGVDVNIGYRMYTYDVNCHSCQSME